MAKTKISEFSATPGNNTDIDGINIAEGCAPSGINDAIRELMAQLKDFQAGTAGDSFNGPVGTTTAAAGAFTTLTTSGAVTHNGGTANGVAYLNGSKVLTTGSALTFDGTNFATTGSGTLKNLLLSGGTLPGAGNPSIALRSSDNVIYHQSGSANTIVMLDSAQNTMQSIGATAQIWNISNSEQMRLTSTGLGIGTSSPLSFANYKTLRVGGSSTTIGLISAYDGTTDMRLSTANNSIGYVGTASNNPVAVLTNGAEVARFDTSGNLGLGVTPSAWSGTNGGAFQFGGGRSSLYSYSNAITLGSNVYYDTINKYVVSGVASSAYQQLAGVHYWLTAPSGTAGNAISFTQAMTLDADGDLGLGTTSPSVSDFTGGALGMHIKGSSNYGILKLESSDNKITWLATGSAATYLYVKDANPLVFGTNNTERARFNSTGALVFAGGNTSANGVGITFPATQSASSDANTLDDYEEGDWTPTIIGTTTAGTGTYNSQQGKYRKIGGVVIVQGYVDWSAHTGTGNMRISNLPFTTAASSNSAASFGPTDCPALTAGNVLIGYTASSSVAIVLRQYPTGGGAATDVPVDTAAGIVFSVSYAV